MWYQKGQGCDPLGCCRQKQDLEQATVIMQEEKDKLEEEAHNLAQKLEAVLQDKYVPREVFDADTPIDKILKLLQTIIGVCPAALS